MPGFLQQIVLAGPQRVSALRNVKRQASLPNRHSHLGLRNPDSQDNHRSRVNRDRISRRFPSRVPVDAKLPKSVQRIANRIRKPKQNVSNLSRVKNPHNPAHPTNQLHHNRQVHPQDQIEITDKIWLFLLAPNRGQCCLS